jgi:hypothetical protein
VAVCVTAYRRKVVAAGAFFLKMAGVLSPTEAMNPEVKAMVNAMRSAVESNNGVSYDAFIPTSFRTQASKPCPVFVH